MATIKDVSEKAGVSSATVSHAINGTRYVSDEVKKRVWEAIRELNYRPNYAARTLRMGMSNTIGLIVPNTRNPYFTEIAWRIEQAAYKKNYSVIICNTENLPERESFYINVLLQKQIDGIIFVTCGDYKESTDILAVSHIPFVVLDREMNTNNGCSSSIMTDEEKGAELVVQHLVELGHTRIGCVTGGKERQISSDKRKQGYYKVMERNHINIDSSLIYDGDFQMQSGYEAGLALLKRCYPPTAIFAFNDLMAIGVMRAAAECGYSIPGDLSVVGYDDIEMASYITPALTTVSQNKEEIAIKAFSALMRNINKKKAKKGTIKLMPKLIVRHTSSIPRNG